MLICTLVITVLACVFFFLLLGQAYEFLKSIAEREDDDDDEIMSELESIVGLQRLVHLDKLFRLINMEEQLDHLHGVGRWQIL